MKKTIVLIIIFTMMTTILFFSPAPSENSVPKNIPTRATDNQEANISGVHNPGTWPHDPGYVEYDSYLDSGKSSILFTDNDYSRYAGAQIYQYASSIWSGYGNQRVYVYINVSFSTTHEYPGDANGPDPNSKPMARMYQNHTWIPADVGTYTNDSWHPYNKTWQSAKISQWWGFQGDLLTYYTGVEAEFSFGTDSAEFHPGLFEIEIALKLENGNLQKIGAIYGEFDYGSAWVDNSTDSIKPTQSPDGTWHWPPLTYDFAVKKGEMRVHLYYAGNEPNWNIVKTEVQGPDAKLLETFPNSTQQAQLGRDYYTPNDGKQHLVYPMNGSEPAGAYVWILASLGLDGETLATWTLVVHNNYSVLNPNSNSTTGNTTSNFTITNEPPSVFVSFTGDPRINSKLNIVVKVDDDTLKGTLEDVWLFAFYSPNILMAPDPNTPCMQLFLYVIKVPVGGEKNVTVQMRFGGEFNVWAVVKDNYGAFNITRAYITVADFEGGGGGWIDIHDLPSWLELPWESTVNLVMMAAGIILMFTRRTELQVLGLALFFASWINWGYVWSQFLNDINPPNWFHWP